jgi:hypothetical protein
MSEDLAELAGHGRDDGRVEISNNFGGRPSRPSLTYGIATAFSLTPTGLEQFAAENDLVAKDRPGLTTATSEAKPDFRCIISPA